MLSYLDIEVTISLVIFLIFLLFEEVPVGHIYDSSWREECMKVSEGRETFVSSIEVVKARKKYDDIIGLIS